MAESVTENMAESVTDNMAESGTNNQSDTANKQLLSASVSGNLSSAQQAVSDGADVNSLHSGLTPLMHAIFNNHSEVADWLLSQDTTDVNCGKHPHGYSTLHMACWKSDSEDIVEKVATKTKNVNALDEEGETPCQMAVIYGGNVAGVLGLMSVTDVDWQVKNKAGQNLAEMARY